MPGPFPGMDPYIEAQGNWQDFHNRMIAELCNALGSRMPDDYVARVEERVEVVGFDDEEGSSYVPDVLIAREDSGRLRPAEKGGGASVATIEPQLIEISDVRREQARSTWLEVRRLPDLELVTVIEILSPFNKTSGYGEYLLKRRDLHTRQVNLVEIDLLLRGERLPSKPPIKPGTYAAVVSRAPNLPMAELYSWTVRHRLPAIPIPLRSPDPDVKIEIQELVDRVYDLGRYRRTLKYNLPLPENTPIHPEDRAWCEGLDDKARVDQRRGE